MLRNTNQGQNLSLFLVGYFSSYNFLVWSISSPGGIIILGIGEKCWTMVQLFPLMFTVFFLLTSRKMDMLKNWSLNLGDFFTISFIQLKPSLDWTKNSFYRVERKGKLLDDELVLIMLMGKITYKEIQKHRNSQDADKAYGY